MKTRDYPPHRDKILRWQTQQEFPICPSNDPDACNVYPLQFPDGVHEDIEGYHEQKMG